MVNMDSNNSNLENIIERILFSAEDLKRKLENLRENNTDCQKQYKVNHRVKELERENIELRQALEDHQYGLEFIMSKYRSQINKLIDLQAKNSDK